MRVLCRVGQNLVYTVYIRSFWQGNHRIYGHIRCLCTILANRIYINGVYTVFFAGGFCREFTKYTVIYGVYVRYFWQGNHQVYGHIRRRCTVLANPITYACTEANPGQRLHRAHVITTTSGRNALVLQRCCIQLPAHRENATT